MPRQRSRSSRLPANFELTPPPRAVPPALTIRLLFGGALNQIGWGLLALGSVLFWSIAVNADLAEWTTLRGKLAHARGRVLRVDFTGYSFGGGGHGAVQQSDRPVQAVYYEFTGAAGRRYEGCSYSQSFSRDAGAPIDIQYRPDDPSKSRAMGLRAAPLPAFAAVFAILPLAGLIMALSGFRKGIAHRRLLARGKPAMAELKSKKSTNVQINNMTVYKLTFEFKTDDGQIRTFEHRTHETAAITDDDRERILYDPSNPTRAHPVDNLPGAPAFDASGHIAPPSRGGAWLALVFPFLTILGNAL